MNTNILKDRKICPFGTAIKGKSETATFIREPTYKEDG